MLNKSKVLLRMKWKAEKLVRPTFTTRQAQVLSQDFDYSGEGWILWKYGPLFCKKSKSNLLPIDPLSCACSVDVYLVLTLALCMHSVLVWSQKELIKIHNNKLRMPCGTLYNFAFSIMGRFTHRKNIFIDIALPSTKKYQVP